MDRELRDLERCWRTTRDSVDAVLYDEAASRLGRVSEPRRALMQRLASALRVIRIPFLTPVYMQADGRATVNPSHECISYEIGRVIGHVRGKTYRVATQLPNPNDLSMCVHREYEIDFTRKEADGL